MIDRGHGSRPNASASPISVTNRVFESTTTVPPPVNLFITSNPARLAYGTSMSASGFPEIPITIEGGSRPRLRGAASNISVETSARGTRACRSPQDAPAATPGSKYSLFQPKLLEYTVTAQPVEENIAWSCMCVCGGGGRSAALSASCAYLSRRMPGIPTRAPLLRCVHRTTSLARFLDCDRATGARRRWHTCRRGSYKGEPNDRVASTARESLCMPSKLILVPRNPGRSSDGGPACIDRALRSILAPRRLKQYDIGQQAGLLSGD